MNINLQELWCLKLILCASYLSELCFNRIININYRLGIKNNSNFNNEQFFFEYKIL